MALSSGRITSVQSNQSKSVSSKAQSQIAIVYSVLLDESHEEIKSGKRSIADVGSVQCRLVSSVQNNELIFARPKNPNIISLPIKNQSIHIEKVGSDYVYTPISKGLSPNTAHAENTITKLFPGKQKAKSGAKSSEYSKVQQTGITRSNNSDTDNLDGFGEYFTSEEGIHKLKLYEGDLLFESRFGQSIRFSGYNNSENSFSPTFIIRNGENSENRDKDDDVVIEEDVNKDGSIILLGSGEYQLPFQPGTVDEGGSSDFETTPDSFEDYPSDLKGDQILLNSGRIILSSKNAEMIFYSKKNYGFISDGALSIDNKFGIEANVGDDINITTNDTDINLNTGNGTINLGDQNLEPVVKGDTLLGLLEELIDAINQQVYLTPSGPSATGPTNIATFNSIKSKLKNFLSTLNNTA